LPEQPGALKLPSGISGFFQLAFTFILLFLYWGNTIYKTDYSKQTVTGSNLHILPV
jgi:hypothetical protein